MLHEDEWFSHAAKSAIRRLLLVVPVLRESFRSYDRNINLHDKVSDSGYMSSSSSDLESNSVDSFASLYSAETPDYFSSNECWTDYIFLLFNFSFICYLIHSFYFCKKKSVCIHHQICKINKIVSAVPWMCNIVHKEKFSFLFLTHHG